MKVTVLLVFIKRLNAIYKVHVKVKVKVKFTIEQAKKDQRGVEV